MFDFKRLPNGNFAKIIDSCMCSVIITNEDYRIEYVNTAFVELYGYTPNEIIGKRPSLFQPESSTVDYKIWETIRKDNEWNGEILNKSKDGELFWEFVRVVPIKDIDGNMFFVSIRQNITKEKELEEKLIGISDKLDAQLLSTNH